MELKRRPEDFVVVERIAPGKVGGRGEHTVYRARRANLSTVEVALRLAREARVREDEVRFAGFKDRRAVAVQHFSIRDGPEIGIDEEKLRVETIGRAEEAARSSWIEANEFEIVVRGLGPEEVERLAANLDAVRRFGLPNYFDDQRFAAARAGKGFPALAWLRGDAEEALRLLVGTPPPDARGWHERRIAEHLAKRPGDFEKALRFVPRRERLFQTMAYQARVWNAVADRWVGEWIGCARTARLAAGIGEVRVWTAFEGRERTRIEAVRLPLPGPKARPAPSEVRRAYDAILTSDGLDRARWPRSRLRGFEFRAEPRNFVLLPRALQVDFPGVDDDSPTRLAARVRLVLPRGSYATLVVKRLFVRTAGREPPP